MSISRIIREYGLPDYGEVMIVGLPSEDPKRTLLSDLFNSYLGFKVTIVDASLGEVYFVSRRLNLVNLGTDACAYMSMDAGLLSRCNLYRLVAMFARNVKDVDDNSVGSIEVVFPRIESIQYCIDPIERAESRRYCESSVDTEKTKKSKSSGIKRLVKRIKGLVSDDEQEKAVPSSESRDELEEASSRNSVNRSSFEACDYSCCFDDSYYGESHLLKQNEFIEEIEIERQREQELDEIQKLILDYVRKYHKDPREALEVLLRGKIVLQPDCFSRLIVNSNTRIILPDYDETEIKLGARERSLYILFLMHPEGMKQNEVCDYREELYQIYGIVKPGASEDNARVSIDNLCEPFSDALRQSISKIKKAVTHVIRQDETAREYYINGEPGGNYSISLSRDKVTLPAAFTNRGDYIVK